jgi:hypothetical protein
MQVVEGKGEKTLRRAKEQRKCRGGMNEFTRVISHLVHHELRDNLSMRVKVMTSLGLVLLVCLREGKLTLQGCPRFTITSVGCGSFCSNGRRASGLITPLATPFHLSFDTDQVAPHQGFQSSLSRGISICEFSKEPRF